LREGRGRKGKRKDEKDKAKGQEDGGRVANEEKEQ